MRVITKYLGSVMFGLSGTRVSWTMGKNTFKSIFSDSWLKVIRTRLKDTKIEEKGWVVWNVWEMNDYMKEKE